MRRMVTETTKNNIEGNYMENNNKSVDISLKKLSTTITVTIIILVFYLAFNLGKWTESETKQGCDEQIQEMKLHVDKLETELRARVDTLESVAKFAKLKPATSTTKPTTKPTKPTTQP